MNRQLHYLCAAFLGAGMLHITPPRGAHADDVVVPYVPEKTDFGGSPVSDLNNFVPSGGNYTLAVEGTANQEITVNGGKYSYTPETTGTVRFVSYNGTVYVYEGNEYKGTLALSANATFPDIYNETDDAQAKTGIYSESNLFKNPGFEDLGEVCGDGHRANNWESNGYDYGSKSRARSNTSDFSGYEGSSTFMLHGYGNPAENLSQQLDASKFKPNTSYKITFTTWSHGNTDNGNYNLSIGEAIGNSSIYSSSFNTGKQGFVKLDQTFTLKTGEIIPENLYFTITRTSTAISHFDRMTFVEGVAGKGITGTISATYLEGEAYAPEIDGAVYDMTSYIQNPSFEINATDKLQNIPGWTRASASDLGNSEFCIRTDEQGRLTNGDGNAYFQYWNGTPKDFSISQEISNLPNGIYKVTAIGAFTQGDTPKGYYLFANEQATEITTEGEYSVQATITNGTLSIGVKAENPEGAKWARADNFKLYYLGYDATAAIAQLQEMVDAAAELTQSNMNAEIKKQLTEAVSAAQEIIDAATGTEEKISAATTKLESAIASASASAKIYADFKAIIDSYVSSNYAGETLPEGLATAKANAEKAYDDAEKDNFSEEIAALNAAQASVASLVISGNMSTLINDPTMDGGETATVWQHESNVTDQLGFQGLQTNDKYPGMNGWALEIYTNRSNGYSRTQKIYQTIENVPNGIYNISATAFAVYQKDDGKNQRKDGVALYANDKETEVPITWNTPNSQIYTVENVEVTNGTLELGLKATDAYCNWMVIDNVTLTKVDETLVLNETEAFNAPVAAATSVTYTRSAFTNNESTKVNHETLRGWQTICLPFDVTEISANDMTLLPIMDATFNDGVDETGNAHPFWLYAIVDGELAPATEIKANVPYLMLVPNDPDFYAPFYNIPGDITFKGNAIAATDLQVQDGSDYDLLGYFGGAAGNLPVQEGTTYYGLDAEGSAFVQTGFASIASFQAFATLPTTPQAAPQTLSIFDDGDGQLTALPNIREALGDRASGIQVYTADGGIRIESAKAGSVTVYTVDGQALQTVALTAGGSEFVALPAGKYIVNGTVVIAQ